MNVKDSVKNNFPKSPAFRQRPISPARQEIIKYDSHVFGEIGGAFLPRFIGVR